MFGRRVAHDIRERPAESAKASKPNIETDIRDASLSLPQQEHRALDPPSLPVAMGCLAERGLERPNEVGLGALRYLREIRDVQRHRVRAVHRITRSKHPAVELLRGPRQALIVPT